MNGHQVSVSRALLTQIVLSELSEYQATVPDSGTVALLALRALFGFQGALPGHLGAAFAEAREFAALCLCEADYYQARAR